MIGIFNIFSSETKNLVFLGLYFLQLAAEDYHKKSIFSNYNWIVDAWKKKAAQANDDYDFDHEILKISDFHVPNVVV